MEFLLQKLLRDEGEFVSEFTMWSTKYCFENGIVLGLFPDRLKQAHKAWQALLKRWYADGYVSDIASPELRTRTAGAARAAFRDFAASDFAGSETTNSPMKICGALVHSLVQRQPVNFAVTFADAAETAVLRPLVEGRVAPDRSTELLRAAPDEVLSFLFAHKWLFDVERLRDKAIPRFDLNSPPMSRHFLWNACSLLQSGDLGPRALYMVFKTFDLCAVHNPVDD